MSEVGTGPAAAVPSAPKKAKGKAATGAKKPKAKSAHPKTSDMVNAAIENLKEKGGSSLQAIKKYISANYKVDAEKMAPFIRKYLKGAVTTGALVQIKGKGASGSFKLVTSNEKPKTAKKAAQPKAAAAATAKKSKTTSKTRKVVSAVKKSGTTIPKKAPAKPKTAKLSPSKAKKTTKTPTKKPKAPKPKKAALKKK